MPELTTHQLIWLCAMYGRECPGEYHHLTGEGKSCCLSPITRAPILDCGGTGRLPLLEGVREPCTLEWETASGEPLSYKSCPVCYGLGWIPTEDVWRWFETAETLKLSMLNLLKLKGRTDITYAFFENLSEALRPLAVNAVEAQEWVERNVK